LKPFPHFILIETAFRVAMRQHKSELRSVIWRKFQVFNRFRVIHCSFPYAFSVRQLEWKRDCTIEFSF
jgi:hypothetical protein